MGRDVLGKIKSMLPTSGNCTVTRIVKVLMNTELFGVHAMTQQNKGADVKKSYVRLDALKGGQGVDVMEYGRSIVFMVGGGCYSEYANLSQFARAKGKDVIYGCTDLVAPNDFLKQLS